MFDVSTHSIARASAALPVRLASWLASGSDQAMGKGEGAGKGKGDGRGGFMDLFQDLEDGMKNIVGCICLMLIGGPIMMLVGVSYINDATTDSRGMAIAEFKSDVSAWSATRELFDDQAFSLKVPTETDARPLAKREAGDPQQEKLVGAGADLGSKSVDGDTSWAAWTPLFYQTTVTVPTVHTPIELHDDSSGVAPRWTDLAALMPCKTDVIDVSPCSNECHSSSRRRRGGGSSSSCTTCSSKCSSRGGAWQSTKNTCSRHLTLTEVNLVASGLPGGWVFNGIAYTLPEESSGSVAYAATHTPADGGTYTSAAGSCPTPLAPVRVPLTVRSEADPVVKAAKLTDYTFDFGNTQAENAAIGSTLVTIGMILTALPCCCGFVVYKMISGRRSRQQSDLAGVAPMQALGSTPTNYAPPQMGMQPVVANAANPVYTGQPTPQAQPQYQPPVQPQYQQPVQPQYQQPVQPQYQQPVPPQGAMPMATATAIPTPMATATAIPIDTQQKPALVASAPPAL